MNLLRPKDLKASRINFDFAHIRQLRAVALGCNAAKFQRQLTEEAGRLLLVRHFT